MIKGKKYLVDMPLKDLINNFPCLEKFEGQGKNYSWHGGLEKL